MSLFAPSSLNENLIIRSSDAERYSRGKPGAPGGNGPIIGPFGVVTGGNNGKSTLKNDVYDDPVGNVKLICKPVDTVLFLNLYDADAMGVGRTPI